MSKYVLVVFIILVGAFFRFYELDQRMQFTWDQVRTAWVMKDIIDDGRLPFLGVAAKADSGFYLGPIYYYLLVPFYIMTNLDPIAEGIFVGIVSLVSQVALFFIIKKLFSIRVSLVYLFISSVSLHVISSDRIPWNVSLLPLLSGLVFFFLCALLGGDKRAFFWLAALIGFSFHIHFTAVYFVFAVLLSLPFVSWTAKGVKYAIFSLPLFFIWFLPHIISAIYTQDASGSNLLMYAQTYYHGFHLTRVFQLLHDGFIEFESLLFFRELRILKFIFLPIFSYFFVRENGWKRGKSMIILVWAWFLVPLIVMSIYSGEISNYYFATTRVIAIAVISYVLVRLFSLTNNILSIVLLLCLIFYSWKNIEAFLKYPPRGELSEIRQQVKRVISQGGTISFGQGDPKSYFYYLYAQRSNNSKDE